MANKPCGLGMMRNNPTWRTQMTTSGCKGCQQNIPLENGKHRLGLPGGYPNYIPCKQDKNFDKNKPIADYLIRID